MRPELISGGNNPKSIYYPFLVAAAIAGLPDPNISRGPLDVYMENAVNKLSAAWPGRLLSQRRERVMHEFEIEVGGEGRWWMISIPEIDGLTRTRQPSERENNCTRIYFARPRPPLLLETAREITDKTCCRADPRKRSHSARARVRPLIAALYR
jgi:hypothetical protein